MAPEIQFPDPNEADSDGLIAAGGNLSEEFLLAAYKQGLFPWYNEDQPILWWSPDPRMILIPEEFHCSGTLFQLIRRKTYNVKTDEAFDRVIRSCAGSKRKDQDGTWIHSEMIHSYNHMHKRGYAHSVETYLDGKLVGGLYGLLIGKVFFGESMFHIEKNTSKLALYYLTQILRDLGVSLIDVQQSTTHLRSMGAKDIPRHDFIEHLKKYTSIQTSVEKWQYVF